MTRHGMVAWVLAGVLAAGGCGGSGGGGGGADTAVADTGAGDTGGDVGPGDTGGGDTEPGDTGGGDTEPGDTLPGDTLPADTTPADTAAGDTVPADTAGDTEPGDTAGDTEPGDTAGDTQPGDTASGCTTDAECLASLGGTLGPCDTATCDLGTGQCVVGALADGAACDDGDPCTEADQCAAGACAGATKGCDDVNACTDDACDAATGACVNTPIPDCVCEADCAGKVCGPDGCGGACGSCQPFETCTAAGLCEACVPACTGKACGDDGCGGTCGTCTEPDVCTAEGQCVDPSVAPGNTCATPFVVDALPFSATGDTSLATADLSFPAGGCGVDDSYGEASPDHVYAFTAAVDGVYTATLLASFDSILYVFSDCPPTAGGCLGGADLIGENVEETAVFEATAGTTVYVVVDGWSSDESLAGPYTLTLPAPCVPSCEGKDCGGDGCGGTCGTCGAGLACDADGTCVDPALAAGNTCANPFTLDAVPVVVSGDTSTGTNDSSAPSGACEGIGSAGGGSNDQVWAFTAPVAGVYTFVLDATYDSTLYVASSCTDIAGTCLGGDDYIGVDLETVTAPVGAGETVYVWVDSWSDTSDESGPYTLSIGEPCLPACEGKACGPDGCGGACGACSAGDTCDEAGQCVPASAIVGNTCANPFMVDAVPFAATGNVASATNAYAFPADACDGYTSAFGGGSADQVYSFTPAVAGVYTITQTYEGDYDNVLAVVTDCDDLANACLGADYAYTDADELMVSLEAGLTYYVVTDGWSSSSTPGDYTLSISEPCLPACEGKACGGDGCGATCGTCGEGDLCTPGGACVPAAEAPGNTCGNPFAIAAVPFVYTGDTAQATNDLSFPSDACPGYSSSFGGGGADQVFRFTPEVTGVYPLTQTYEGDYDNVLAVVTDCEDLANACLGADYTYTGDDELEVKLEAGTAYFIVTDAWSTSATPGTYTLTVGEPCLPQCDGKACGDDGCGFTCGECGAGFTCDDAGQCLSNSLVQGNTCENPFVVDAVPFAATGDTADATNDLSFPSDACPGYSSSFGGSAADQVYAFTPEVSGVYTLTQTYEGGYDNVLAVVTDCADLAATCVGGDYAYTTSDELVVALEAGTTYFIVTDGWSSSSTAGAYSLAVSEPCLPTCDLVACGGDDGCGGACGCAPGEFCSAGTCTSTTAVPGNTCDNPVLVDAIPFSASGDTTLGTNDFSYAEGACEGTSSGKGAASRDVVYRFSPPLDGVYTASVDAAFDAAVYVVTNCTDVDASCLGGADGGNPEEVTFPAAAGSVYFIVVDGWSNLSDVGGAYTLTIGEPCIPSCEGKACGADGCGATCGVCPEGDACDLDGQCVPVAELPGNTCATPFVVDALPFAASLDVGFATDDVSLPVDACAGYTSAFGGAGSDQVFAFTPEATGVFTISQTYEDEYDNVLAVFTDCADPAGSCLEADYSYTGTDQLTLELAAGVTYFILSDHWSDATANGTYTLGVAACVPDCDGKVCGDDGCLGTCGAGCAPGEKCAADGSACGPDCCAGNTCCDPLAGGCDDPVLEACVCALDDFCCSTAWDDICAEIAELDCAEACFGP